MELLQLGTSLVISHTVWVFNILHALNLLAKSFQALFAPYGIFQQQVIVATTVFI